MDFQITRVQYKTNKPIVAWAESHFEVYVGDTIQELEFNVVHENSARRAMLMEVMEGVSFPFKVKLPSGIEQYFALVYPIPVDETKVIQAEPEIVVQNEPETMVKNEPEVEPVGRYRPYKDRAELYNYVFAKAPESLPALARPLVWIKHKESGNVLLITGYLNNGIFADNFYSFEELYEKFEYMSGKPCGFDTRKGGKVK